MLIKIVAMFRNLLISSFDATTRKRAFHPAPASRGFASHVFLVKWMFIDFADKTDHWNEATVLLDENHETFECPGVDLRPAPRRDNVGEMPY